MKCAKCGDQDAVLTALDAIATICGFRDWEYPGQLVREVQTLSNDNNRLRDLAEDYRQKWLKVLSKKCNKEVGGDS